MIHHCEFSWWSHAGMKRIPGFGGPALLQWMQISADSFTKHETNPLAALHFVMSSWGSSNYMSPKWMKCSTKWVSESGEVSLWQAAWRISVVVNSSAMSYLWLVDFNLQCNRWWWCPSGIYRWPYSRTDDGDSFLGKKCSVTLICR